MSDAVAVPENLNDLLGELVEPVAPATVSMWPQTVGWLVLAGVCLVGLAAVIWWRWRVWQAAAYRRAALVALAEAGDDPAAIAAILRRAALAAWPREQIASLTGAEWLAFLDRTGAAPFPSAAAEALRGGIYQRNAGSSDGLGAAAARWIASHDAGAGR